MSDKSQHSRVRRRKPATTPEARENQLISDAYGLAERQIADGTVSAQVLTHFLRLGTEKYRLERAKLEADTKVSIAKVESMEMAKRLEEKYDAALNAMRNYGGYSSGDNYDEEEL